MPEARKRRYLVDDPAGSCRAFDRLLRIGREFRNRGITEQVLGFERQARIQHASGNAEDHQRVCAQRIEIVFDANRIDVEHALPDLHELLFHRGAGRGLGGRRFDFTTT